MITLKIVNAILPISDVNNTQCHRRESLEINPVPVSIDDDVIESSVCRALFLTGHEVKPDDLQACLRLKKMDAAIIKFKCRKQRHSILISGKNLRNKSNGLTQLNFSGRLFVLESMCHGKHQLSYKCRQLKNACKIHSMWFWNNSVNVKLNERSQPTKIHHVIDIEKLLGVDNLDEFISNTSF